MSEQIGVSDSDPNAGLAMILASAAYCADPATALKTHAPQWSVPWQADQSVEGNLAFIAYNGSDQYVVAIRGSILRFDVGTFYDWFEEDFNVFEQVPWMYPASDQKPMISRGSADGLDHLQNLIQTKNNQPQTMWQFLLANAIGNASTSIAVVGHSLGGNLATVFAAWLSFQIKNAKRALPSLFPVLTFAAPSAGNEAFAQAYDASFPNSWRYYNKQDIVPRTSESISSISDLFVPEPAASQVKGSFKFRGYNISVTMAEFWYLIAGAVDLAEELHRSWYSQTNLAHGSCELDTPNSVCPASSGIPTLDEWGKMAECQHDHQTYLDNLGKGEPPFNCQP